VNECKPLEWTLPPLTHVPFLDQGLGKELHDVRRVEGEPVQPEVPRLRQPASAGTGTCAPTAPTAPNAPTVPTAPNAPNAPTAPTAPTAAAEGLPQCSPRHLLATLWNDI